MKWTVRDHDKVAGGSVYHLTDAVDGGPISAQDYVLVHLRDDAESLWRDKLAPLGVRLILEVFADLDAGHIAARPLNARAHSPGAGVSGDAPGQATRDLDPDLRGVDLDDEGAVRPQQPGDGRPAGGAGPGRAPG